MPKISALPPMTTADAADEAPIVDTSATTTKKWTLTLLKTYLQSLTGWITAAMLDTGMTIQTVETDYSSATNATSVIPYDDTVPQITEGYEVMTQSITPKRSDSYLLVEADIYGSYQALGEFEAALFRDSTANAIAADSVTCAASGYLVNVRLKVKVAASSTAATTFRVRVGSAGSSNSAFNGYASGGSVSRVYNTTPKSSIKVTEIRG